MAKNTRKALLADILKNHDSILEVDLRGVKFDPSAYALYVETLCLSVEDLRLAWVVENKDLFLGSLAYAAFRYAYALEGYNNERNYTELDDRDPTARDDLATMLENNSHRMVENPAQTLLYAAGQARIAMGYSAVPTYRVDEKDIEWLIGDGNYTSEDLQFVKKQVDNEVTGLVIKGDIDLNDADYVAEYKTLRRRELLKQKQVEAAFKYSHASTIIEVMVNEDLVLTQPEYNGAAWESKRNENICKHVDKLNNLIKTRIIPAAHRCLVDAKADSAKARAVEIMAFVKNLSAWVGVDADKIITDLEAIRAKVRSIAYLD
jgi:hypothetical protein